MLQPPPAPDPLWANLSPSSSLVTSPLGDWSAPVLLEDHHSDVDSDGPPPPPPPRRHPDPEDDVEEIWPVLYLPDEGWAAFDLPSASPGPAEPPPILEPLPTPLEQWAPSDVVLPLGPPAHVSPLVSGPACPLQPATLDTAIADVPWEGGPSWRSTLPKEWLGDTDPGSSALAPCKPAPAGIADLVGVSEQDGSAGGQPRACGPSDFQASASSRSLLWPPPPPPSPLSPLGQEFNPDRAVAATGRSIVKSSRGLQVAAARRARFTTVLPGQECALHAPGPVWMSPVPQEQYGDDGADSSELSSELSREEQGQEQGREQTQGDNEDDVHRRRGMVLTSRISSRMMRAVRVEVALQGFGSHWASTSTAGGVGVTETSADYLLSENVDHIDDFVSHDWMTGRWPKFLTLCLIYNGVAAYTASFVVGVVIGSLQAIFPPEHRTFRATVAGKEREVHTGLWSVVVCPVVFLTLLFFGQRLRRLLLGSSRMAFVDKLCIHQTDPEMKSQGILGIAGFLRRSDRLVVLWSPRYFTRLWCVYEVATWIYLAKKRTRFLPVAVGVGVMFTFSFFLLFYMCWTFSTQILTNMVTTVTFSGLGAIGCLSPVMHALRHLVRDLRCMQLQIDKFSARSAECFCCAHGHVHPVSNEPLSCDRRLVYETLLRWFELERTEEVPSNTRKTQIVRQANQEAYLDQFDHYVREEFGPNLLRKCGGTSIRYRFALIICSPCLWFACDQVTAALFLGTEGGIHFVVEAFVIAFCTAPAFLKLVWGLAVLADRWFGTRENRLQDFLLSQGFSLLGTLALLILWFPLYWARRALEDMWLLWLVCLGQVVLSVLLFREQKKGPRSTEDPDNASEPEAQTKTEAVLVSFTAPPPDPQTTDLATAGAPVSPPSP